MKGNERAWSDRRCGKPTRGRPRKHQPCPRRASPSARRGGLASLHRMASLSHEKTPKPAGPWGSVVSCGTRSRYWRSPRGHGPASRPSNNRPGRYRRSLTSISLDSLHYMTCCRVDRAVGPPALPECVGRAPRGDWAPAHHHILTMYHTGPSARGQVRRRAARQFTNAAAPIRQTLPAMTETLRRSRDRLRRRRGDETSVAGGAIWLTMGRLRR